MNKRFALIALILVILGALLGGIFGRKPAQTSAGGVVTTDAISSEYLAALALVNENYVGNVNN